MKLSDLGAAVDFGLTVLNHRILTLLALCMTFGLFCWSMYLGNWVHFAIAGAFGICIFLPVLIGGRGGAEKEAPHD
jgi:uncharacterized SAM-binding protein YcdF (DUF218 family)